MTSFTAQVKDWTKRTEKAQEHIFKSATQRLVDAMLLSRERGGNMPVVTGNLYRSLLASTSAMPSVRAGVQEFPDNSGQVAMTINSANLGDTIYLGFQAAYARRVNYGFVGTDSLGRTYNQSGSNFVGLAAQRWQEFVDDAIREYDA